MTIYTDVDEPLPNEQVDNMHWLARALYEECFEVVQFGGSLIKAASCLRNDHAQVFWNGFNDSSYYSSLELEQFDPLLNDIFTVAFVFGIIVRELGSKGVECGITLAQEASRGNA